MAALCWSSREEIPHAQGKRNPTKMVGTHSSTRGLRPPEQLERPAGFPSSPGEAARLSHPTVPRAPLTSLGVFVTLLQHLPSYLGFSYLGRGVSLHGYSSKAQLLLLTLD